ncbi:MAG: SDR family oxidoreductase [Sphingobium sp.]|jgi:3-oxoacyl-[acyl-carrier protein] reductase|nr:SDR family oxidoreductase [Sphingobium sp.]MCI2053301.1 SDR family oxidoreductase [Sphingobium sp.]
MNMRVAIVTGGAGGIGGAIIQRFLELGYRVASIDLPSERHVDGIIGENLIQIALDLRDLDQFEQTVARVVNHFGRVDVLVNNGGIVGSNADDGFGTLGNWREVMAINLDAVWGLCKAAAEHLARSSNGRIINIGSINSEYPSPGGGAYPASKHAVYGLTKCLAFELGGQGVTVNAVLPGAVETGMTRSHPSFESWSARVAACSAVGRIGRPEDVAAAVAFLASEEAGFITGHGLYVDGGLHLNLVR